MNPDTRLDNIGLMGLAAMRRAARPRPALERCDLCSLPLPEHHAHLVEVANRRLLCACEACAILFSGQAEMKYRRVPRDVTFLTDFRLSDIAWEALQLPINLAFFLRSTPARGVVAFYPSPAGATESRVALESWAQLEEDNPILRSFEPDVEALLVNRVGETREYYRAGIDECYRLVGLIRMHWHGLSGGQAVWDEIDRYFNGLKQRSGYLGNGAHG